MGGGPDPWTLPPSAARLPLCENGLYCSQLGWTADAISDQSVMFYAEAASNRDGRVMHDNYGPVIWCGPATGGDQLCESSCALLAGDASALGFCC